MQQQCEIDDQAGIANSNFIIPRLSLRSLGKQRAQFVQDLDIKGRFPFVSQFVKNHGG